MKILSDKKQRQIITKYRTDCTNEGLTQSEDTEFDLIAQAQLEDTVRQIVEWGDELCWEHHDISAYDVAYGAEIPHRRNCAKCWKELDVKK